MPKLFIVSDVHSYIKPFKKALEEKVDLVILQSRSPSCGVKQIYDGSFSGNKIDGQGIFAKLLKENNIRMVDVEDLICAIQ